MPSAVVEVLEEEEEPVIVGELSSPLVAGEITLFVEELRTAKAWVGLSAFLLFVLCRRLRVFVWYGTNRADIVENYAPWASEFISEELASEAIASRIDSNGVVHALTAAEETNHWVACIKKGVTDGVDAAVAVVETTNSIQESTPQKVTSSY